MIKDQKQLISVITPCYNEEANIYDCYLAVKKVFDEQLADYDYEHIFCDNASLDKSLELMREIAAKDKRVKMIANSRNFGASRSSFNGLLRSKGDAVIFTIAADLQDPPSLIPEFVKKWKEGHEVVYGIRIKRQENFIMSSVRKLYYRLMRKFIDFNIPADVGDFQLIDKVIVNTLRQFDDYCPYVRGLIAQCGFRTVGIKYLHLARKKGMTTGGISALINLGLNGIISFTNFPLRVAMMIGLGISILSISYAFIELLLGLIFFRKFTAPGIATIIISIFFFSGIQLFFLGVIGEYIGAIHSQVRKRPLVIEKEILNFD